MKKLIGFLFGALLLACSFTVTAHAAGGDFEKDFFPNGTMEKPETPYVVYKDTYDDGTPTDSTTELYYFLPKEVVKLYTVFGSMGSEAFTEKYGEVLGNSGIQVDFRFEDGVWLSESYDMDAFEFGAWSENDLAFTVVQRDSPYDPTKLMHFTQSWMAHFGSADPYMVPYGSHVVSAKDANGHTIYRLDIQNHTLAYRVRYFVSYKNPGNDGAVMKTLFSPWSDATFIGKDGSQREMTKPTSIPAPIISKFEMVFDDDFTNALYLREAPNSFYDVMLYYEAVAGKFEPFEFEVEARINGGEWFSLPAPNSTWMIFGSAFVAFDQNVKKGDDVEIRLRIASTVDKGLVSPWSNVIGTDIEEPTTEAPSEESHPVTEKPSEGESSIVPGRECALCHSCPV